MSRALDTFVARAQAALGSSRIILFGSRARHEHLLTSDVDLLVISDAFAGLRDDDRIVRMLELWEGPVSLQPLCFTPDEFEARRAAISIVAIAEREGRALA